MTIALVVSVALARPVAAAEPVPEGPRVAEPQDAVKEGPSRRTAVGEVVAGSVLTASGLFGVMWMSFGFHLTRMADRELVKGAGWSEPALAPLHAQREQGQTLIGAGAVVGVLGLGIGLALLGVGVRDLRASRGPRLRVRLAPSPGGAVLVGRF